MAGIAASCAFMYWDFWLPAVIVLGFSLAGLMVPAVVFLVILPIHLVLMWNPTAHDEIARNTLHHQAVVWCEQDPSLMEVFAHLKHVFDNADGKTRRDLITLILGWETPNGAGDVCLSNEEAQRQFHEMFPNKVEVEVEDKNSAWRAFSQKYLRI